MQLESFVLTSFYYSYLLLVASVGVVHGKRDFYHTLRQSLGLDSELEAHASYELFERVACCSVDAFTPTDSLSPEFASMLTTIGDITVHPSLSLGDRRFVVRSDQRQQCLEGVVTGVSHLGGILYIYTYSELY